MWRALLFLALLALAAWAAVWIADHPGTVTVEWNGYAPREVDLPWALAGILVVAVGCYLLFSIVRGVVGFPSFLSRSSRERRRAKGMSSLSRGMIAVGSGDPLAARRHAGDAERLLGTQPLTLLLTAQAAQISGDREAAERAFQNMTDDPETRVLGLRGLFVEARRREDEDAARAYATEAARLAPSVNWANEAVLEAQCADGDWSAATETVERRAALGLMDKPLAKRQRAILLTAAAQSREAGEPEAATEQALKAVKLVPDLVPAACIAGRLLARKGDLRKAAKVIETAWKANPHPELAKVYLGLRPGDSTRDRLARAESLAKLSSWDPQARIAVAQTAYESREFARAREVLAPLAADRPTAKICLLMARIEESEHGSETGRSREWLARAARAPRDPAWIADGVASERWAPVSPITGRLDAFVWKAPPEILSGPDDTRADMEPPAPPEIREMPPLAAPATDKPGEPEDEPVLVPAAAAKPADTETDKAATAASSPAAASPDDGTAPTSVVHLPRPPDDPGDADEDDYAYPYRLRSR